MDKENSGMIRLNNNEMISAGDVMQFRVGGRLAQTELKLICGKATVGELKKCLYDEKEIEVFRPTS